MPHPRASGALPRPLLAGVVALAALLVAGIVAIRFVGPSLTASRVPEDGPIGLVPVDAPQAGSAECGRLLAALPTELVSGTAKLARRVIAAPAPPATLAWGAGDPVVLRCGLPRPDQLTPTASLLQVSGVQWLQIPGDGASTWYAVDRPVYVALTLPTGSGSGPLQDVSAAVGHTLPATQVNPLGG